MCSFRIWWMHLKVDILGCRLGKQKKLVYQSRTYQPTARKFGQRRTADETLQTSHSSPKDYAASLASSQQSRNSCQQRPRVSVVGPKPQRVQKMQLSRNRRSQIRSDDLVVSHPSPFDFYWAARISRCSFHIEIGFSSRLSDDLPSVQNLQSSSFLSSNLATLPTQLQTVLSS